MMKKMTGSMIDILSNNPSELFEELDKLNILNDFLPELTALKGYDVVDGLKHKDNFYHTLKVIKNACDVSDDPYFRFVALIHDFGKSISKKFENGKWCFHNHEEESARMVKKLFKRFELDDARYDYVYTLVKYHGIPKELAKDGVSDSAIRRFSNIMGDYLNDMMLFCKCDITTRYDDTKLKHIQEVDLVYNKIQEIKTKDIELAWRSCINGHILMKEFNVTGRELGVLKNKIETAIKNNEIPNNLDDALDYAREIMK